MWADMRAAVQALQRSPVFAATAIATLAVGIGTSSAIFSLVHAVLLQPLPFHDPGRLIRIWEANPSQGDDRALASKPAANDWRESSRALADIAVFRTSAEPTVLGFGDVSVQAKRSSVTANIFDLLGVEPMLGRGFRILSEGRGPLDATEVVLSHAFWQRTMRADPAAIGSQVRIEGVPGSTIVGVMPPAFVLPDEADVWTPIGTAGGRRDDRTYGAIARLADDATLQLARAELTAIASSVALLYPETNTGWTTSVLPLHEAMVGSHRLALLTLLGAVAFVMLVASANLANLLLARGIGRREELAIRAALGAGRIRLARLLLTEASTLALGGAALGVLLAWLLLPVLVHFVGSSVPRASDARIGVLTAGFATVCGAVAAAIAGLLPAWRASRHEAHSAVPAGSVRLTTSATDGRLQRWVLTVEFAVCLVLLVGAMLFARTFVNLRAVDLGFNPEHVISLEARTPIYQTLEPSRWQRVASETTEALDRVRATPGVLAAAATSDLPLSGNLTTTEVTLPDDPRSRPALYHRVTPEYFPTMGMTIVAGRDFTNQDVSDLARLPDARDGSPREGAVIVNETTAKAFWPSGNAVGQFLSTSYDARFVSQRQVVGIVRDARSETVRSGSPIEVYVPYLEDPSFATILLIRSDLPAPQLVPVIRRELRTVSTGLSTAEARMLDDVVGESLRTSRFNAFVLSAFAVAGLALSALGIFGVFAFGVTSRLRELGIRIAIGATRQDIVRMFLVHALRPVIAGVVLGTAASVVLTRFVGSLLFNVAATDATNYAVAVLMLASCALVASYLPVRRVLRSDPSRVIRE